MRIFNDAHYRFIEARRKAYVVSGIVLAIGIAAMVFNVISIGSWQNYGVDFTGGTLIQAEFAQATAVGELRDAMAGAGMAGAQIQQFGASNDYLIRTASFGETDSEGNIVQAVGAALDAVYGADGYEITRVSAVGPKVGSELQRKAAIAILMSFALTLIYLAFRKLLR